MTYQHYSIAEIEKMNAAAIARFDPATRWVHGRFTHHMRAYTKVEGWTRHDIFSNACECRPLIVCGSCGSASTSGHCGLDGHLYHYILHRDFS